MDKTSFLEAIGEIGKCGDDIERRKLLDSISDEVTKVYDNVELLNTTINSLNESLTKSNSDLETAQKANMEFWLKLNAQKTESEVKEENTGIKEEEKKEYKSYSDLAKSFMK